jgi:hypothetical protein
MLTLVTSTIDALFQQALTNKQQLVVGQSLGARGDRKVFRLGPAFRREKGLLGNVVGGME